MPSAPPSLLAAALAASFGASLARGQAPDCTYDTCALRLQHKPLSRSLVQGARPTPVARLGLFAPRIDLLAAAGDSTRSHYAAFRTHYNRGAALTLVAIATFTASLFVVSASYNASDPQQYEGAAVGLLVGGVVVGFGADVIRAKAEDHLQQAIWFYNRALPRGP